MKSEGYDALIIYSDEYRSGQFHLHHQLQADQRHRGVAAAGIIVGDKAPVVFLGRLNAYAAKDMCWIADVRGIHRPYTDFPEIFSPIAGRQAGSG